MNLRIVPSKLCVADHDQVGIDRIGNRHQHRRRLADLRMLDHPHAMAFARVVTDPGCGLRRGVR